MRIKKSNLIKFNPYSYRKFYFFRSILLFLLVLLSIALSSLFIHDLLIDKTISWTDIILPLSLLIIPVLSFPLTEEWVYKPWTKQARKPEKQYFTRSYKRVLRL